MVINCVSITTWEGHLRYLPLVYAHTQLWHRDQEKIKFLLPVQSQVTVILARGRRTACPDQKSQTLHSHVSLCHHKPWCMWHLEAMEKCTDASVLSMGPAPVILVAHSCSSGSTHCAQEGNILMVKFFGNKERIFLIAKCLNQYEIILYISFILFDIFSILSDLFHHEQITENPILASK